MPNAPAMPPSAPPALDFLAEPPRLALLGQHRGFHRGQEIYGQEGPTGTWYRIVSGAARQSLVRADGRRQVVAILLPGELFGLTVRTHHKFAVEAIVEGTVIASYPRQRVEALADEDPATAREIRLRCLEAMARLQDQVLAIGTMTAQEKVHAILIYFRDRLPRDADDGLALPISRYDIADMLGISAETVCRAFTELQQRGVIALDGPRHITIVHRGKASDSEA